MLNPQSKLLPQAKASIVSKGKLLFRKTIRKSLKNGGSLYDIVLKPKIKKKPRLILLCDISGSMALYSLFGLTLLFGVVQRFRSVHAYVFIDGITNITKELKNLKFNNINKILTNWNNYVHVDGHSDYEKSFKDLLDEKIISNSSFNTLIVIDSHTISFKANYAIIFHLSAPKIKTGFIYCRFRFCST